jgi:hypothetical protein
VRLRTLADAFALAALTFLLAGGLTTVANLNPSLYPSQEGRDLDGSATVLGCDRLGPVSVHGFGYWWRCRVEVALPDGRLVTVTMGRSIVSPDDFGRPVPVREHCEGTHYDDCTYGKEGDPLLAAGASGVMILAVIVALVGIYLTGVAVYNALIGRPRWWHATFSPHNVSGP